MIVVCILRVVACIIWKYIVFMSISVIVGSLGIVRNACVDHWNVVPSTLIVARSLDSLVVIECRSG
jgi:hypothetical protein